MFTIGLEFSLDHLKKMKHEVFVTGTLQIVSTSVITYAIAFYIFGIDSRTALIIAFAIALSSTAIVLKTFNDTGEINRRYGQRSLGILIMQDIAVVPILLIITFMSSTSSGIIVPIIEMVVSALVLLVVLFTVSKYLLEPFFAQITSTKLDELFVGTILFLAIGSSYLAHALGFSYSLGALLAGMLIARTKYKYQAEADLIPFRDLLLGIFFITVGMQLNFLEIVQHIPLVLGLLVFILVIKFTIIFFLVRSKETKRISFKTALSLVQVGEFSLAILELARSSDLISSSYSQIMIFVIILSMIITPFILKNITSITDLFFQQDDHSVIENGMISDDLRDHVVIIGFSSFGKRIASSLKDNNQLYIAIDNNIDIYHQEVAKGEPIIFGNFSKKNVLKGTHLQMAKYIIIAIDNPSKLYNTCQNVLKFIHPSKVIARVHRDSEKQLLLELDITKIVVEDEISSKKVLDLVLD
jgi:CPA2 family monovalent cation:H+ antiporter-2